MPSRQKDLVHLEEQITALGSEARAVQDKFQKYSVKVGQRVREILEKAEVWEEVNNLEVERNEAAKKAQARLQDLDARAKDLQRVRSFLLDREQEDPEVPAEDVNPPEEEKKAATESEPSPDEVWEDHAEEEEDLEPPEF